LLMATGPFRNAALHEGTSTVGRGAPVSGLAKLRLAPIVSIPLRAARVRKFSVGENVAGRENLESAMTLILIPSRSGVSGSGRDTVGCLS
jgi:hypothetical protein